MSKSVFKNVAFALSGLLFTYAKHQKIQGRWQGEGVKKLHSKMYVFFLKPWIIALENILVVYMFRLRFFVLQMKAIASLLRTRLNFN